MNSNDKNRTFSDHEISLIKIARKNGLKLKKSKKPVDEHYNFGGYMIVDRERKTVLIGGKGRGFSASLQKVENYLNKREKKRIEKESAIRKTEKDPLMELIKKHQQKMSKEPLKQNPYE